MALGLDETICYQALYNSTAIRSTARYFKRYHGDPSNNITVITITTPFLQRKLWRYMLAWIRPHAVSPVPNPPPRQYKSIIMTFFYLSANCHYIYFSTFGSWKTQI
jgi:hypothetical protein